jgi:hypothetical protein
MHDNAKIVGANANRCQFAAYDYRIRTGDVSSLPCSSLLRLNHESYTSLKSKSAPVPRVSSIAFSCAPSASASGVLVFLDWWLAFAYLGDVDI